MPTDLDLDPDATPLDGPGPRAERAARSRRRRRRRTIGGVLLVVGIGAAAAGVLTRDDGTGDGGERPVGKLTEGQTAEAESGSTDAAADASAQGEARVDWPRIASGRPTAFGVDGALPPAELPDLEPGFYVFNDFTGWHLWVVGDVGDATAEVVLDAEPPRLDPVGGEFDLEVDRNRFVVGRGNGDQPAFGVDFSTGLYGRTMIVTVTGDVQLHVGATSRKAASPLGLRKALPDPVDP